MASNTFAGTAYVGRTLPYSSQLIIRALELSQTVWDRVQLSTEE